MAKKLQSKKIQKPLASQKPATAVNSN